MFPTVLIWVYNYFKASGWCHSTMQLCLAFLCYQATFSLVQTWMIWMHCWRNMMIIWRTKFLPITCLVCWMHRHYYGDWRYANNKLSLCITYCYTYNHLCVSIINYYFYMPIVIAQSKYLMLGSLYKGCHLLSVCCIVCMYMCQFMPCHMVNVGLYLE